MVCNSKKFQQQLKIEFRRNKPTEYLHFKAEDLQAKYIQDKIKAEISEQYSK